MIDKSSSIPLYLQIQNLLIDRIREGEYPPGTQVPSELEIASRHKVSRMTARKALDAMVSKGILYRRKGKGTYVAQGVVSYGLSTMLSFSRTLQAQGYNVVTKVLRIDVVPGSSEVLEKLHLSLDSQVIVIRRLRLIEGIPAAIHTSFLEHRVFASILNNVDLSTESLLDTIQRISGMQVAYTRDSVQADLANVEDATLLEIETGGPVLRVEGVAYAENSQPTRFTRAVYRGDMFRLMVKNTADLAASLDIFHTLSAN
jgi:GntR family transcriptional regulator